MVEKTAALTRVELLCGSGKAEDFAAVERGLVVVWKARQVGSGGSRRTVT